MRTKAISPVIATVIIVSVAIAIAVAVAFWMTGITGLFTRYEKLEVVNAYATYSETIIQNDVENSVFWNASQDGFTEGWNVTVVIKNTGSTDATIDEIFINGKPFSTYKIDGNQTILVNGATSFSDIPIKTGETKTLTITIAAVDPFSHGIIVEVKIHTAAGNEYPKSVQLP